MHKVILLIPSLEACPRLLDLVEKVQDDFSDIVIVNDGSQKKESYQIFDKLKTKENVHYLEHAVNLGKGAALKFGLNYIYTSIRDFIGVITADSDGQHTPADILKMKEAITQNPDKLCLGVRSFSKDIPFRSYFGNKLTIQVFTLVSGVKVSDTQTGLRAINKSFIPELLQIRSMGYEFEMEMLIKSKNKVKIHEVPIKTVYIDHNSGSHFNPIRDSFKIYFVLLRFVFSSLSSAVVDTAIFSLLWGMGYKLAIAQYGARFCSFFFNFFINKSLVFKSQEKVLSTISKFTLLVIAIAIGSHSLIVLFNEYFGIPVIPAKLLAELIFFSVSFTFQRDFVFANKRK